MQGGTFIRKESHKEECINSKMLVDLLPLRYSSSLPMLVTSLIQRSTSIVENEIHYLLSRRQMAWPRQSVSLSYCVVVPAKVNFALTGLRLATNQVIEAMLAFKRSAALPGMVWIAL